MKKQPFIFAVSGVKNAGKTTFITKLLPVFVRRGLQVATIKHDGHEFEADVPGTDTWKHLAAGAYGTAIFSEKKYMVVKQEEGISEKYLQEFFPEVDLILLEGGKQSRYPKIEIIRKGISKEMVCHPNNVAAVISDFNPKLPEGMRCYTLDDVEAVADLILDYKYIQTELSMVILAGGKSSRMGTDKADLRYGADTFLEIQIKKGKALGISDILVSGYRGNICNGKIIPDSYLQKGPLGGMEASFRALEHESCLVISVDTPLLPVEELRRLIHKSRKSSKRAVILVHDQKPEPLIGVYQRNLTDEIVQEILYGKGSVRSLLDKVGYEAYESKASPCLFQNVNTPEEYDKIGGK